MLLRVRLLLLRIRLLLLTVGLLLLRIGLLLPSVGLLLLRIRLLLLRVGVVSRLWIRRLGGAGLAVLLLLATAWLGARFVARVVGRNRHRVLRPGVS